MELRHSLNCAVSLAKVCEFLKFQNEDMPALLTKPLPDCIFNCPWASTDSPNNQLRVKCVNIKKQLQLSFNAMEEAEQQRQEDTQGQANAHDMFMQQQQEVGLYN